MKHEIDGPVCYFCNEKLEQAVPELKEFFLSAKKEFPDLHCSWTFRNKEEQNKCFKDGATRLEFPKSKHNQFPSLAIDVFQINEFGAGKWDNVFMAKLNTWQEKAGFGLKWGGKFKVKGKMIHDGDHFEIDQSHILNAT